MSAASWASAGASVAGALFGELWASGDEKERKRLEKQAQEIWDSMGNPPLEEFRERALQSGMVDARGDADAKSTRRQAYQKLMQVGLSGGMDDEAKLAQEEARRAAAQDESSQRNAVLAQSRARGMSGSGLALAAQLQAQQGAANRNSMAGQQAAADARRRALQALQAGGQMAGDFEADDFGQQEARAAAQDRIAMFNEQQRAAAVQQRNAAQQQRWQNQYDLNQQRAGSRMDRAGGRQRDADRKRRVGAGVGAGIGYGIESQWGGGKGQP